MRKALSLLCLVAVVFVWAGGTGNSPINLKARVDNNKTWLTDSIQLRPLVTVMRESLALKMTIAAGRESVQLRPLTTVMRESLALKMTISAGRESVQLRPLTTVMRESLALKSTIAATRESVQLRPLTTWMRESLALKSTISATRESVQLRPLTTVVTESLALKALLTGSRPAVATQLGSGYFLGDGSHAVAISSPFRIQEKALSNGVEAGGSVTTGITLPAADSWQIVGCQVIYDSVVCTGTGNAAAIYSCAGTAANADANGTLNGSEIDLITNRATGTYVDGYTTVMDDQGSALLATGNAPVFVQKNSATTVYVNWGGTGAATGTFAVKGRLKLWLRSGKWQPY